MDTHEAYIPFEDEQVWTLKIEMLEGYEFISCDNCDVDDEGVMNGSGPVKITFAKAEPQPDCDYVVGLSADGMAFDPVKLAIKAGETVCWQWKDASMAHNVLELEGEYDSTMNLTNINFGFSSGEPAMTVDYRHTFTENDKVYMRTVTGPEKIDVIYRRLDDEFLDPLCFNQDSLIGVPGIMNSYRTGNVTICSAPGSGIADDKAIYSYVPEIIKFYLSEKPILENVKTWNCSRERDLKYVLSNLKELVVKEVHGSGGYGMLVGPNATKNQIKIFTKKIKNNPSNYIAQHTLALSTCPTFTSNGIAPRHVDFRPFCLMGKDVKVCKGGLTRVALKENSLIVNSSQGGGVKDTWVLQK